MTPKFRELKAVELCTSHVSEETAALMDAGVTDLIVADYSFGWLVRTTDDEDDLFSAPEDLRAVLVAAHEFGASLVLFDRDADEVEGLETFDW